MPSHFLPEVRDRLRLIDASSGDRLPGSSLLARPKWIAREQMSQRLLIQPKIDDSFCAHDLQPEPRIFGSRVCDGIEEERESMLQFVPGMDFLSRQRAHAFVPFPYIGVRRRLSILENRRAARRRLAAEIARQIQ